MTLNQINTELNSLYADKAMLFTMNEAQICKQFNVDCKREAEQVIDDDIAYYESLLAQKMDEEESDYWSDNGFANESDYNHWRYGA